MLRISSRSHLALFTLFILCIGFATAFLGAEPYAIGILEEEEEEDIDAPSSERIIPPSGYPGGGDESFTLPFLAVVVTVAASAVVFAYATRNNPHDIPYSDESDTEEELEAIGDVAGDAANRLQNTTDVENEIYRAWRTMLSYLNVTNTRSATAGEFAERATDAGMAQDDVETLTTLFEEVRYGDCDPTMRRQAAISALRNIEQTYGSDEEPASDADESV